MQTKAMIALFGLFAEVERDLIAERTKEGLAAARAKGKKLGRPKGTLGKSRLDGKEQVALAKACVQGLVGPHPGRLAHHAPSLRANAKTSTQKTAACLTPEVAFSFFHNLLFNETFGTFKSAMSVSSISSREATSLVSR